MKLLTEYENVAQKVLFNNAILAALMSGRKYDVISQNGDCSRESNVRTLFFETKSAIKNRGTDTSKDMESACQEYHSFNFQAFPTKTDIHMC
jgi:formylmethanofuran dehydrogenase subunit A